MMKSLETRYLEWKLSGAAARNLETALAHQKENRLPLGSDAYRILYREVREAMQRYCEASGETEEDVIAHVPAIWKLRQLAEPGSGKKAAGSRSVFPTVVVGLVTAVICLFLIGASAAVISAGNQLVSHLFG